jgi:hypothetical protein
MLTRLVGKLTWDFTIRLAAGSVFSKVSYIDGRRCIMFENYTKVERILITISSIGLIVLAAIQIFFVIIQMK